MTITTITRETKTTGRDFAKAGFRIDFTGEGAPDGLPPCAGYFRAPPRFLAQVLGPGAQAWSTQPRRMLDPSCRLARRFRTGLPARILRDRGMCFQAEPATGTEFKEEPT